MKNTSAAAQKIYNEYSTLFDKGAAQTFEDQDRLMALGVIMAELHVGLLTKNQQLGTDADVIIAAEAWLEKMDAVFAPEASQYFTKEQIEQTLRVRKHIVEICHASTQ